MRIFALAIAMLLGACSPLQPVETADEAASAASQSSFWTDLPSSSDDEDWFVLLNRGLDALDWRLNSIDSATETIDLQTFLLQFDVLGASVLEHLIAAADRGVRVRLLVDDSFLIGKDELIMLIHEHENMAFRVFNPYKRRADSFFSREVLNLAEFHRLDHRMHNKVMVVDGQVAIVGGRNLADEYFGLHDEANFRDLELLVGGEIVSDISNAFADYWNDDWSVPIDQLTHVEARPVDLDLLRERALPAALLHVERSAGDLKAVWASLDERAVGGKARLLIDEPPRENPAQAEQAPIQLAQALIELVDSAQEEIIVVSAYLIPTPVLEDAVRRAESRGVSVRFLTNSIRSNNHVTAHAAYRTHIETLIGMGAELHEVRVNAQDRPIYIREPVADKILALHAKALIVDRDRVFVGSANLDPRSLRINTEMGLLVNSETLNAELRDAVSRDFEEVNAWSLQLSEDGRVSWVSGETVLTTQPAESRLQRLEDWFFAHLPIEDEL